jgi:hypothetical protein
MQSFQHLVQTVFGVFFDGLMFLRLWLRPSAAVVAENLFLRKQLGLFVERRVKPQRATDSIRFTLGQLSRWFDWREALIVVQRETLTRWHRKGFRLFWNGSLGPAAVLQCPPMFESSFEKWPRVIQPGAKSALPMNSC